MTFAINKTRTTIDLRNGFTKIMPLGYIPVTQRDLDHPHFIEAQARGWIDLSETEPTEAAPVTAIIETISEIPGGMTTSEFIKMQAEDRSAEIAVEEEKAAVQAAEPVTVTDAIVFEQPYQGMTEEEFKADQAAAKEVASEEAVSEPAPVEEPAAETPAPKTRGRKSA